jgi:hypothetical protein
MAIKGRVGSATCCRRRERSNARRPSHARLSYGPLPRAYTGALPQTPGWRGQLQRLEAVCPDPTGRLAGHDRSNVMSFQAL